MSACLYSCLSYTAFKSHFFLRRIILPSVACLALPYSSTLSHKWHDFRKKKKINQRKLCVLIFSELV